MPNYSIPFFRKLINKVFLKFDVAQVEKSVETGRNGNAILKDGISRSLFFEDLAADISKNVQEKTINPETLQKKYNTLLKKERQNEPDNIEANSKFIDALCRYAVGLDATGAENLWFGNNKSKIIALLDQLNENAAEGLLKLLEKLVLIDVYSNSKSESNKTNNRNNAFLEAMNFVHSEQLEMLDKMAQNKQVFITGKPMYDLYKVIAEKFILQEYLAISYKDLHYWSTPAASHWLTANQRMVNRGVKVERIFVISEREQIIYSEKHQMALRKHIADLGIKIRILVDNGFSKQFVNPNKDLDFAIYDNKFACYWNQEWGIYLEMWFNKEEVAKCKDKYQRAASYCEIVPGKTTGDNRLIENGDELEAWLRNK
ncbi:hypothetical protein C7N43_02755 [Sphingobacteriales bacterium UPWRP_1]|nr:hypothetical protein BVG80_09265 [Sphingobacteriales bacterium TSM_CSM]PSJ78541.1 hypothetical protein C7N43_02755 [Sphingobacteriales bacterium UPWRP_1]